MSIWPLLFVYTHPVNGQSYACTTPWGAVKLRTRVERRLEMERMLRQPVKGVTIEP